MRLVAIGLVAGVFSAFFGVGGGIVAVPLLILVAGFPERVATATSLLAIAITASAGVIVFGLRGEVEVGYAALVGLPAAAGAVAGTAWQQRIRTSTLTYGFAALLTAHRDLAPRVVSGTTVILAILLGLAAGVMAGLFGVGGGILFVPTLVALGLGQLEAQGTSLLAILPTVLAGSWNQRRYGNLRVRSAVVVGLASIVGVEIAARVVVELPEDTLRRLFAVLLFAVAVQLVWRTRRKRPRYPDSP